MEDDRVAILEAQLSQAKLIAEEADKKYEEVDNPQIYSLIQKKNIGSWISIRVKLGIRIRDC